MCVYVYLFMYIIDLRCEDKSSINTALSEESLRKRNRRNTVNIKISFIAWSLEFSAGIILILHWYLTTNKHLIYAMILIDVILRFILIPGTYLLNTDVIKALVISNGWFSSFRGTVQANRIFPTENDDIEMQHQVSSTPCALLPNPISTISGNISALGGTTETKILTNLKLQIILENVSQYSVVPDLIICLNLLNIEIA